MRFDRAFVGVFVLVVDFDLVLFTVWSHFGVEQMSTLKPLLGGLGRARPSKSRMATGPKVRRSEREGGSTKLGDKSCLVFDRQTMKKALCELRPLWRVQSC